MKKIPTLFRREFDHHNVVKILPEVTPGLEWVLEGEGIATEKIDGSCCAVIDGEWYRRYDAKKGRSIPPNTIPCQDKPDPITGHWPHWLKLDLNSPADKWYIEAFNNSKSHLYDGTYEAIGPHFQGNVYNRPYDHLIRHGIINIEDFPRTFDGMRDYLKTHNIEGVVFWKDEEPKCKIKRSDFGFEWPVKNIWRYF